jgi:hypothetical protein
MITVDTIPTILLFQGLQVGKSDTKISILIISKLSLSSAKFFVSIINDVLAPFNYTSIKQIPFVYSLPEYGLPFFQLEPVPAW